MAKRLFGWIMAIVLVLAFGALALYRMGFMMFDHEFIEGVGDERVENVVNAFNRGTRMVVMNNSDPQELDYIVDRIYDNPNLFWVDMTYNALSFGDTSVLVVREKYEDIEGCQAAIDAAVSSIVSEHITRDMSEYDKVLAVHDWICKNVDYGQCKNYSDQDIYGALVLRRALCAGYAESFAYVLNKIGIRSEVISGESINKDGESVAHAWNLVYIDGEPYYFDVTWDDDNEGIIYDWFGVTSEEFKKSHFPSAGYDWVEATCQDANYYKRNGMFIDSYNYAYIVQQINKQGTSFTIKCSDWLVMNKTIQAFSNRDEVRKIMKGANIYHVEQIVYTENERVHCLHVVFK